jgi:hypothetical protein
MAKRKPRRTKLVQVRVTPQMERELKRRANLSHDGVVSLLVLEQLQLLIDDGNVAAAALKPAGAEMVQGARAMEQAA